MLRTIEHNVSSVSSDARIIERTAVNSRFPVRALPMLHRWLKGSGSNFLWDVDGNMRRREWESLSGPTLRVGVGVFAFEDPVTTSRTAGLKPPLLEARRRRRARSTARGR
jgi:hypothetical protein